MGKRWLLATLGPVVLLGTCELALRLAGFRYQPPAPPIVLLNPDQDADIRAGVDLFQESGHTLWELRPGAAVTPLPADSAEEFIGPQGFRGWNPSSAATLKEAALVACLGDSSTFGFNLALSASMPAQLGQLLNTETAPTQVLNAGCIGFSVCQGLELYRHRLRPLDVDVLVLTFGCINESRPCTLFSDEEKLQHLSRDAGPAGKLVETALQLRLAQLLRLWLPPEEPRSLREWVSRQEFRRSTPQQLETGGYRMRVEPERFRLLLDTFLQEALRDDAQVILVIPSRLPAKEEAQPFLTEYDQHIRELAQQHPVTLLDFRQLLRDHPEGVDAFHLDRVHPNARGNELWARSLAQLARPLLTSEP